MKPSFLFRRRAGFVLAAGVALLAALPSSAQAPAKAAAEKPQYGGELNIANVFATVNPMSPDTGDWAWKHAQDTGLAYEQLFAADLTKSVRHGGKHTFTADAWISPDALRGELAEKWEMKQNPLRVEVTLRKGVMFPAKPGVMESREFTADPGKACLPGDPACNPAL